MPDIQAQTADGVMHSFPEGTRPEVIDGVIKKYVQSNALTQQTKAAAQAAGAPTGPAPMPRGFEPKKEGEVDLANPIMAAGARLDRLGGLQNRALTSPTPVTSASSVILPVLGAQQSIEQIGLRPTLSVLGRGALKSAAGSQVGRYVGRGVGSMFGDKGAQTGEQVGEAAGALAGPFVSGKSFARLPFGVGRLAASNEEYAAGLAERKLAQRNADIAVGLRTPPDELTTAIKEGRAARLPVRLPTPAEPKDAIDYAENARRNRAMLTRTSRGVPGGGPATGVTRTPPVQGKAPSLAVEKPSAFEGLSSTSPSDIRLTPSLELPPPREITSVGQPQVNYVTKGTAVETKTGLKGSLAKPSGRLVLTPEETRSTEQMQKLATRRASEHGMQYAAGMRPAGGGRVPVSPTATLTEEYQPPREIIRLGTEGDVLEKKESWRPRVTREPRAAD